MMKRILFTCTSLCALMLALSVLALAQAKGANFAGTWELDKSKSKMDERMAARLNGLTLTVTQDEKSLKVDPKADMAAPPAGGPPAGGPPGGGGGRGGGGGMMGGGFRAGEYKLDGSESVTENQRGKTTTKTKWMDGGKILEIAASNTFSGPNGEMTTTSKEHWELADGLVLKVHRVQETPRGTQETTFVFNKK